jgi:cellulose synthase/poly-beta-1,6-N-acetylglucosamine synthase-like glycosyltransferase
MALWIAALSGGMLAAVWLGYPLVMWVRARVRPRPLVPHPADGARRTVTVVLATRDRLDTIVARVTNLLASRHPAALLNVIVAWDGDAEGVTAVQAALHEGLAVTQRPHVQIVPADAPGGKACALNAGVRAARGDRLVFADTAQRFDDATIPALVAALEDPRFGAVSGVLQLPDDASPLRVYWALERFLRRQEAIVHASIGVTGAIYAMPRALWTPLPPGTLLDDVWVPMQLVMRGQRVGVATDAQAWDVRQFGAKDEVTRKTRTQAGVLQLLALIPGLLSPRNPVRWSFVWHKLARLLSPVLVLTMALALVVALGTSLVHAGISWRVAAALGLGMATLLFPIRRRLRSVGTYFIAMQWALVRAVLMAWSGRWSVWHPTRD